MIGLDFYLIGKIVIFGVILFGTISGILVMLREIRAPRKFFSVLQKTNTAYLLIGSGLATILSILAITAVLASVGKRDIRFIVQSLNTATSLEVRYPVFDAGRCRLVATDITDKRTVQKVSEMMASAHYELVELGWVHSTIPTSDVTEVRMYVDKSPIGSFRVVAGRLVEIANEGKVRRYKSSDRTLLMPLRNMLIPSQGVTPETGG